MRYRNSVYKRFDPLLVLACAVAIGVVLTTSVQAGGSRAVEDNPSATVRSDDSRGWFTRLLDRIGIDGRPSPDVFGIEGSVETSRSRNLDWHFSAPPQETTLTNNIDPGVHFGVTYHW